MHQFVRQQIAKLLARLAFEVQAGTKSLDPERVHHLRVATRRLATALRVFEEFLPEKQARRVRKRLREMMRNAAALRDRDIALKLLLEAGAAEDDPLLETLRSERRDTEGRLAAFLKSLKNRNYSAKWRQRLELPK
jgi:CHAD domain-containing protein